MSNITRIKNTKLVKAKYCRTTLFFRSLDTVEMWAVSGQIHGEVSQEYQNIDISSFPLAPFICYSSTHNIILLTLL